MNSNGQRLLDQCSTASRANLGCVARINQYDHTTSILSFVRGVLYQLVPGRIRNTFRQAMVLKHGLDVQFFKSQQTKAVHQVATAFVSKIPATVGDTLVDMSDRFTSPGSFGGSLSSRREVALCLCQCFFVLAKEAGIGDPISVREGRKGLQANIDTDGQIVARQRFRFDFTCQAGIPIANRISLNGECLEATFNRAMQNNFDYTDPGKKQTVVQQLKTRLFERETVYRPYPRKRG